MRFHGRYRQILRLVGGVALLACAATRASATIRIQKEAVALGYPASNCNYCHVFDSDHMKERGRSAGIEVRTLDCYACHKGTLPKTGPRLLNERGLFLLMAKRHLRADKVSAEWLDKYRSPSPAPSPEPKKKSAAKP